MAETMLVRPDLTPEMIERGRQLIEQIEGSQVTLKAAFWYLDAEVGAWRLIIACPDVRTVGPAAIYRKIRKALGFLNLDAGTGVSLDAISVVDTDHPLVRALAGPSKTIRNELVGAATIGNVTAHGVFVSGVHLYRP